MNNWKVYDLEIFPNLFLAGFRDVHTGEIKKFEVSPRKDERRELALYIRDICTNLIGFNSKSFDEPLLVYFLKIFRKKITASELVRRLKAKSSELIGNRQRWKNFVKKNKYWKDWDLFSIMHYDNVSRMTSLKLLEFNLKMLNIQNLPYAHDKILTEEEIENVCLYLDNDLEATLSFYLKVKNEIDLRVKMTDKFGFDMTNMNAPKMGEQIIIKLVKDRAGIDLKRLPRIKDTIVKMSDIIYPYISFKSVQFNGILNWLNNQTVTETKGVFTEIDLESLEELEGYYYKKLKKGKQENLNVLFGGIKWVLGLGGIHACADAGVYDEDEGYEIRDVDVTSYYPFNVVANKLKPRHFPDEFSVEYEKIYDERKTYPKGTAENLGLKLALNGGGFGKGGDKYSCFYDPAYLLSITVNGQLLLCMLAEELSIIPNVIFIQANTDGITLKYPRKYAGAVDEICRKWEEQTTFQLEHAYYSKMVIKDVNNYIAVGRDGYVKRKGAAFMHKVSGRELDWHKDHSFLVIPKAIEAYFLKGTPPQEFLDNHRDMYDFMGRVKVNRNCRLLGRAGNRIRVTDKGKIDLKKFLQIKEKFEFEMIHDTIMCRSEIQAKLIKVLIGKGCRLELEDLVLQNLTRYVPVQAEYGYRFIKEMPALKGKTNRREIGVDKSYDLFPLNDLRGVDLEAFRSRINMDYYLNKINQIIEKVEQ
jgi:hypothetical protein